MLLRGATAQLEMRIRLLLVVVLVIGKPLRRRLRRREGIGRGA